MGELNVQDKQIVVPGEVLATGMDYLPAQGTYRLGDNILASQVGMVSINGRLVKTISLAGKYVPKRGDTIIAKITEINLFGWRVDLNCAYTGVLNVKDASNEFIRKDENLNKFFTFGDYILTKISNVTSQMLVDLTMRGPGLRKLGEGRVIKVSPSKVPRIIGKGGSMVSLIKDATKCRIIVGQNGIIWISGEPQNEIHAINAIRKIDKESHISGLTERIKEYLSEIFRDFTSRNHDRNSKDNSENDIVEDKEVSESQEE